MQRRLSSARRSMRFCALLIVVGLPGIPGALAEEAPASPASGEQAPQIAPASTSPASSTSPTTASAPALPPTSGADAAAGTGSAETEPAELEPADPSPAPPAIPESSAAVGDASAVEPPTTIAGALESTAGDLDLVEVQIEAREFDTAREWLESHVATLERGTHRYDPALIRPLTLLGDANMGKGAYVEALQHYERAIHLARVSAGLKTLDQVEIVHREAAVYKALGRYQDASDREEYAYQIVAGQAAPNDPALLPALYRLADWYLAMGNAFPARELYDRAIRILDATGSIGTEAAVPALQGLATTYRLERYPLGYAPSEELAPAMVTAPELQQPMALNNYPAGEQALQQVVRIRQQAAAPDPMGLVEAVLDLGDWYTLFDKPSRSGPLYAHAFELLTQIPGTDSTAYFADPKPLYIPVPGTPRSNRADADAEALDGFVELGFDITETGYVRNVKTLASEPPGLMDIRVRRSLRVARYRPAVVDGIPVASANQTYRHEFPYHAKPDEAPEEPKAEVVKE